MAELYRAHSSQGASLPPMWRRNVKSKYKAQIIAAHHADVRKASYGAAIALFTRATGILAEAHSARVWTESAHPRIVFEAGLFTDYYVYLETDPHPDAVKRARGHKGKREAREESALAAAASIEFGRRAYTNSHGEHIGASQGVRPLSRAMGMLM